MPTLRAKTTAASNAGSFAPNRAAEADQLDLGEPDLSYRMSHGAPYDDSADGEDAFNRQAHDLASIFPSDVYDHPHRYGSADTETIAQLRAARGNPDAMLTIYRAVPKGVTDINKGDWVTLSRAYATQHSYGLEDGLDDSGASDGEILSYRVPASQVWTDGNDLAEFGYDGPTNLTVGQGKPSGRQQASAMSLFARATLRFPDAFAESDPEVHQDGTVHLATSDGGAVSLRREGNAWVSLDHDRRGEDLCRHVNASRVLGDPDGIDDALAEATRGADVMALEEGTLSSRRAAVRTLAAKTRYAAERSRACGDVETAQYLREKVDDDLRAAELPAAVA